MLGQQQKRSHVKHVGCNKQAILVELQKLVINTCHIARKVLNSDETEVC